MKSPNYLRPLTILAASAFAAGSAHAALIAHYTFDSVYETNKTADSVGSAFATLGGRVVVNTTVPGRIGGGVLEMLGSGATAGSSDGAVTSNTFSWTNDARTVTFWWRAKDPNVNTSDGAFVSFGGTLTTAAGNGTRFEIKEQQGTTNTGPLRVEVQGAGQGTNPTDFDDGNWHFVAVTVPNAATFADIAWYAGVRGGTLSGDLNTSASTQAIATAASAIVFGDSVLTTGTNDRVPNGYIDDFRLYDEVLTTQQISALYAIPEPSTALLGGLGVLALLRRRRG